MRTTTGAIDGRVHDVAEVDALGCDTFVAGKLNQIADQSGELLHLRLDVGQDRPSIRGRQHAGARVRGK